MTNRERVKAILNYEEYDRMPILHFGFWSDTLQKWSKQGHITEVEANNWADSTPVDKSIGDQLGFDFNWYNVFSPDTNLRPCFERAVLSTRSDGCREVRNICGNIEPKI